MSLIGTFEYNLQNYMETEERLKKEEGKSSGLCTHEGNGEALPSKLVLYDTGPIYKFHGWYLVGR